MIERHTQYMYSFRSRPNDLETNNKDDADEDLDRLLDDINLSLKWSTIFLFQTLTFAQNGAGTAVEEFENSIIRHNKTISDLAISNIETLNSDIEPLNSDIDTLNSDIETLFLKFGDGDGPNLYRVRKVDVSSTLFQIYFGLGWLS